MKTRVPFLLLAGFGLSLVAGPLAAQGPGARLRPVPATAVSAVPWSQGHSMVGTVIGAGAGALLGTAVAAIAWRPCSSQTFMACWGPKTREDAMLLGAGLGAVAGALVGWAVGASIHGERAVPPGPGHVRLALAPGGAGLGASFAF